MPDISIFGLGPLQLGLLGVMAVGLWAFATGLAGLIWPVPVPNLSEREKVDREIEEEWQLRKTLRRKERPLYKLAFMETYVRPLTEELGRLFEALLKRLELGEASRKEIARKLDLVYAGRQNLAGWWGQRFASGVVVVALLEAMALSGVLEGSVLMLALGFGIGIYLPVLSLNRSGREMQAEVVEQLPNFIDLLTIHVQGGAGLEEAMRRVARQGKGVLPQAVRRAFQEASSQELVSSLFRQNGQQTKNGLIRVELADYLREGKGSIRSPLMRALRRMAERLQVRELNDFVSALETAEEQGVAITGLLTNLGTLMRNKRSTQLTELGQKLVGRMVFPLVLFILPAFALLMLTPALLQMLTLSL